MPAHSQANVTFHPNSARSQVLATLHVYRGHSPSGQRDYPTRPPAIPIAATCQADPCATQRDMPSRFKIAAIRSDMPTRSSRRDEPVRTVRAPHSVRLFSPHHLISVRRDYP
jgi:hypothetical protein